MNRQLHLLHAPVLAPFTTNFQFSQQHCMLSSYQDPGHAFVSSVSFFPVNRSFALPPALCSLLPNAFFPISHISK